tara:strand:- start:277 stop:579 length:303 start_codon:yes stop_codon:yes gene_type:complete
MRIDLQFFMAKQRITLEKFCEIHGLGSYDALVRLCESKNIRPCSEEVYVAAFPPKVAQKPTTPKPEKKKATPVPVVQEKPKAPPKSKPQRRRRTKKSSEA